MSDVQAKVWGWVDGALAEPPEGLGAERIELCHMNAADQLQRLATYAGDAHELKLQLWQTAQHVVGAWNHGLQRFALRAYRGAEVIAYYPFALAPLDDSSAELSQTEPANHVGVLKMLMRHTEALSKINAGMSLEMLSLQQRSATGAHRELEALRARYHDVLARQEDALLAQEDRKLAHEMLTRGEARKDAFAAKAATALAPLVNIASRRLGGPELVNAPSPVEQALAGLLASLDDRRFEALMAAFPEPAHQAVLVHWYRTLVRKEGASSDENPDPSQH